MLTFTMAVRRESRRGTCNQVVAKGTVTHLIVATIILIRPEWLECTWSASSDLASSRFLMRLRGT